jgi:tetratricopeptide (TPR) repeat protein
MGLCHYNHRAFDLALTCLDGAVKIRKHHVSRLTHSSDVIELYDVEVALAADYFMSGNAHMHLGDYAQAMQFFIQSRDLRWRHVGSGTVEKILDRYFSEETVDEEELLGLAHCLHNIGVVFDIKKEYQRSKPHYEEALAIKNAIAGFSSTVMSIGDQANPDESRALVLHSLTGEDHGYCQINKAALSASVTRQRIAMVYVKLRKYDHALFHFSHALRIQRSVLGKDHFSIGSILSNMGNALCRTSTHPDTAIHCYSESLRISRLRFGQNHTTVASAMFDLGNLYDSTENFTKAMHYYRRALSVYRQKYSQNLTRRLCSGLLRPIDLTIDGGEGTEFLSTGDEIVITSASHPANQIREQYARVTEALRRAKRKDIINRGERIGRIVDSDDAWLTFEALMFRFVEMLSNYVVDPAQTMVNSTINGTRHRIESFAAHAVISAADTLDYQFLLDNM